MLGRWHAHAVGELSRLRQLSVRALLSPEGNARRGAEGQNKIPAVTAGRNVTPHSIRALEKNRFTVAALDDWKRQDSRTKNPEGMNVDDDG